MPVRSSSIHRRRILQGAVGSVGVLAAASATDLVGERVLNRLAATLPGKSRTLRLTYPSVIRSQHTRRALENFAATVKRESHGELRIAIEHGAQVENQHAIERLKRGDIEIALSSPAFCVEMPAVAFFNGLPFENLTATQKNHWLTSAEATSLWTELYKPWEMMPVFFGGEVSSYGQFSRRAIDGLGDLRGLRVSVNLDDLRQHWYIQLGMVPVVTEDFWQAGRLLRAGELDLSETFRHSASWRMPFFTSEYRYYVNDWLRTGNTFNLLFTTEVWARFTADEAKLLRQAAITAGAGLTAALAQRDAQALSRIRERSAHSVAGFAPAIVDAFRELAATSVTKIANHSPLAQEIATAYQRLNRESLSLG